MTKTQWGLCLIMVGILNAICLGIGIEMGHIQAEEHIKVNK